jgi:hypothetical protein
LKYTYFTEAICTYETSVYFIETTCRYTPESCQLKPKRDGTCDVNLLKLYCQIVLSTISEERIPSIFRAEGRSSCEISVTTHKHARNENHRTRGNMFVDTEIRNFYIIYLKLISSVVCVGK